MGDEAERLSDMGDDGAWEYGREYDQQQYYAELNEMQKRYEDNKRADIGTTIRCAYCAKRMIKRSRQHQFCSNKNPGNCKDSYWNNVNDTRRDRAHRYS